MKRESILSKAIYEKRIVAFLDILGFRTMIEDSKTDTALRRKIKEVMELIRDSSKEYIDYFERIVSTFSDSVVISYKLRENSLFNILIDIIHLQLKLGSYGMMIRGGIAIGDCYHDGDIVFGPAMNEAYRLESKVAIYPRVIILEETLFKAIELTVERNLYGIEFDINDIKQCLNITYYEEDNDNQEPYFVDFLRQPQELIDFGDEYYSWLKDFRVALIEGLNRYSPQNDELTSDNETNKIFKKYRWLLAYWNSVIEDDNATMPVPMISPEDQKGFRENYKKLRITKKFPYY